MAIFHCNTNGFYAILHRLTLWRSYFTATLYLLVMGLLPVSKVTYFTDIAIVLANVWTVEPQSLCETGSATPPSYSGNCCVQLLHTELCIEMAACMEQYNFLKWIVFSDQTMFFLSCEVKRQNVQIWGIKPWKDIVEYHCDNPKVTVICAMSSQMVYGPFFM
jgi:hypothetical protein